MLLQLVDKHIHPLYYPLYTSMVKATLDSIITHTSLTFKGNLKSPLDLNMDFFKKWKLENMQTLPRKAYSKPCIFRLIALIYYLLLSIIAITISLLSII